ncbi:hypothetical protein ACFL3Z_00035 [Gemmatimonadota bacterium]
MSMCHRWTTLGAVLLATGAGPLSAQQVTAEDVVTACAEALGGRATIDSFRTLRIRYTLPDHSGQSHIEIKRPNLIRSGDVVVFDGKRAAFLDRGPAADGTPRPAQLIDREEWKDFEVDIARYFPAFFDYPSEYLGMEALEGIETHKLDVVLPLGGKVTYYIDAATYLPFMVESRVNLFGKEYRSQRFLGDYREVGGILYPHQFTYYSPHVRVMYSLTLDALEINIPLDNERFRLPPSIR